MGDALFYGKGAGKLPTASAVVSDIIEIAKSGENTFSPVWEDKGDVLENPKNSVSKHFARIKAENKNEMRDKILSIFDNAQIIDIENGEICFVTENMTAEGFNDGIEKLNVEVISTFLVLS